MPPEQLALIQEGLIAILPDYAALSARFYHRLAAHQRALSRLVGAAVANQEGQFGDMLGVLLISLVQRDTAPAQLRALGQHHRQYGVGGTDYEAVGRALLEALAETLGPAWTQEQHAAWTAAYGQMAAAMQAGIRSVGGTG